MIPNTRLYYIFIRLSIWALRAIVPISIAICLGSLAHSLGYGPAIPLPLTIIAYAESIFYVFISVPIQWSLDRDRPRTIERTREERKALFERCWTTIPNFEEFHKFWFKGASLESIHREDLKDLLAWVFFYQTKASLDNDDELEFYVRRTEEKMDWTFPPGRSRNRPMQVSIDALQLQHKPLLFYVFAMGPDDFITYIHLLWIGLRHFRLPLQGFFTVFPFRPQTIFTRYISSSKSLSYWYRPHTSKKRKPVLFIHGIGAGMRTYTGFLSDFLKTDRNDPDGQIGIIALELMPISMRITKGILPRAEMLTEVLKILDHHGWEDFVIMGHSHGSIIATHLLQRLRNTDRIGSLLLVDPVTLSMHWGDIPYNFLYRQPRNASEWQLHYFASTDMCVAHSLTRRFDWSENVMWEDDMIGRSVTVVLAEKDIIMNTSVLRDYLLDFTSIETRLHDADDLEQLESDVTVPKGTGVDVLWYHDINHAGVWDRAECWRVLINVLRKYCVREEIETAREACDIETDQHDLIQLE